MTTSSLVLSGAAVVPLGDVYGNASPARAAPSSAAVASVGASSARASAAGGTGCSGRAVPQFQQTIEDAKFVDEHLGQDHASPIDNASLSGGHRRPPSGSL